jgi:predicted nucleotidyltransferase
MKTQREITQQLRTLHLEELHKELNRISGLFKNMGALKIILFGSCATNTAGQLSDLDLFIVMDTDLPFIERLMYFYKTILPSVPTDILVYTPEEFDRNKDNPFIREIIKNGKIIYEK